MKDGIRTHCQSFLAGNCQGIYTNRYKQQVLECTTCPKCETGETLYSNNTVTVSQPWLGVESPAECGRLAGHGLAETAQAAVEEFPIGDLTPWFPCQLERAIYEGTPANVSVPMAPHQTKQGPARHLTLNWVAKRADCSLGQARQLIDCMVPLEATENMASTFCKWARARGIDATVQYLQRLAIAAETSNQRGPAYEWVPHRQVWMDDRFQVISWVAKLVYPEPTEEDDASEFEFVPDKASVETWRWQARSDSTGWVKTSTCKTISWVARVAHQEPNPETIEYHRVGEQDEESPDYIEARPWLQALIQQIRATKTLHELGILGKRMYETNAHQSAWAYYKTHKAWLESRAAKATPTLVKAIIARIQKATEREIGSIGKTIYNLQAGKAKAACDLSNYWSTIWQAYKARKQQLA